MSKFLINGANNAMKMMPANTLFHADFSSRIKKKNPMLKKKNPL